MCKKYSRQYKTKSILSTNCLYNIIHSFCKNALILENSCLRVKYCHKSFLENHTQTSRIDFHLCCISLHLMHHHQSSPTLQFHQLNAFGHDITGFGTSTPNTDQISNPDSLNNIELNMPVMIFCCFLHVLWPFPSKIA